MRKPLLISTLCLGLLSPLSSVAAENESTPALIEKGIESLHKRQLDDAVQNLEAGLRLAPEHLPALQALAEAYLLQQKLELAEATLKAAHKLDRSHVRTHYLRGRLRFAQHDYLRARSEFRVPLYFKQQSPETLLWLARTESELQNTAAAQEAVQKAFALDPKAQVYAALLLLQAQLEPDRADVFFQQAFELKNLDGESQKELRAAYADYLRQQGRIEELLHSLAQRLSEAVQSKQEELILERLGELSESAYLSESSDKERALFLRHLEKIYEQTGHPLIKQTLIREMIKAENFENLLAFYRYEQISRAPQNNREWAELYHRTADVHLKLGYLQFAFDNYEKAVELNERDFVALRRMGVIYLSAGDPGEALKHFKQVLDITPLDRKTRAFSALALAYLQRKAEAQRILADLPAQQFTELRTRVEAVLASGQRQPNKDLWRALIPDAEILGSED